MNLKKTNGIYTNLDAGRKMVSDDFFEKYAYHSPDCGCTYCAKVQAEQDAREEEESRMRDYHSEQADINQAPSEGY